MEQSDNPWSPKQTDASQAKQPEAQPGRTLVEWTATGAVEREHGAHWRRNLTIVGGVVALLMVLLFALKVTSLFTLISSLALIAVMLIAILAMDKLPNDEVSYRLDTKGLTIEDKFHPFGEYRAFGVRKRDSVWQLVLIPVKRFSVETVAFIDPTKGERIVDILATQLPMENVPENGLEHLVDKLNI